MLQFCCCRYLYAYEDLNRKLGITLVSTLNRPDRGRHPSSRSLVSFRDRERLDRPVESLLKSATRIASKRSSSIKDEPSTPTASGPDDSLVMIIFLLTLLLCIDLCELMSTTRTMLSFMWNNISVLLIPQSGALKLF
jgi:hypothetical protein